MRETVPDGIPRQPARLLRETAPAPGIANMAWRSAGSAGLPAAVPSAHIKSAETEQDMQRRLDAARQQGRAEGEASGAQQSARRLDPAIASFNALMNDLTRQRARQRAETEEDTVKLALAIARRVLHRELSTDPESLLGLVKAGFQKLSARETQRLRVSPQDAAFLQEHRARLDFPQGLEITPDSSLPGGSAVFETSRGELDASVDTQIAEIERGLTDIMRRRLQ